MGQKRHNINLKWESIKIEDKEKINLVTKPLRNQYIENIPIYFTLLVYIIYEDVEENSAK